jgi:RHS repeat-associated protein
MGMPGRKHSVDGAYRYGFNGKENDNDVKGEGNQQDYGMRVYDPRLGKFLSVDPITKKYPMLTPYQFASNSPISGIDLDGLEFYYASDGTLLGKIGTSTQVRLVDDKYIQSARGYITWANGTEVDKNREYATNGVNKISTDVGITNEELNTRAVLVTIRYAENDGNGPLVYDAQFGMRTFKGKDLNKDGTTTETEKYADHPRERVSAWGLTMDVAGAYQFKSSRWDAAKKKLDLKDFSPASQDLAALQLIRWQDQDNPRAKGVIENIKSGKIGQALRQLNGTWTSLPAGSEQLLWFKEAFDIFKKAISNELKKKSDLATPQGQIKL